MGVLNEFDKDPAATLDYSIDWEEWLIGAETITVSTWAVPAGLVNVSDGFVGPICTVWLSGGTASTRYVVTNHITTSGARIDERSLIIEVKER